MSRSYVQILKTHPAEGWVKYRHAKTTEDLEKINQMHEQIRILEQELARLREVNDHVPANLARGADVVRIDYGLGAGSPPKGTGVVEVAWNAIFLVVGTLCLSLPKEWEVEDRIDQWLSDLIQDEAHITGQRFQTVKIQFYALGLIRIEMLMGRVGVGGTNPPQPTLCWVLTEAGRGALAELLAEKRPESDMPSSAYVRPPSFT